MQDEPELDLDAFDAEPPSGSDARRLWLLRRLGRLVEHVGEPLVRVKPDIPVTDRTPLRFITFTQAGGEELWALLDDHGLLHLGRVGHPAAVVVRLFSFNRKYSQVISMVASRHERRVGQITDLWVVVNRWAPEPGRPAGHEEAVSQLIGYHAEVVVAGTGIMMYHAREGGGTPSVQGFLHPLPLQPDTLPGVVESHNALAGFGDDLFRPEAEALDLARLPPDSSFVLWTPGVTLRTLADHALAVEKSDSPVIMKIDRPAPLRAAALRATRVGGPPARGKPPGPLLHVDCFVVDDRELAAYRWSDGQSDGVELRWTQPLGVPARGVALGKSDASPTDVDVLVALRNGKVRHYRPLGKRLGDEWEKSWTQFEALEHAGLGSHRLAWLERLLDDEDDDTSIGKCLGDPRVRQALLRRAVEVAENAVASGGDATVIIDHCAQLIAREDPVRPEWPCVDLLARRLETWPSSANDSGFIPALIRKVFERGASLACRQRLCLAIRRAAVRPGQSPGAADVQWLAGEASNAFDDWSRPADANRLLHRAGIGFERWGNRFLLSDKFTGAEKGAEHLQHVTCLRAAGSLWIAVVRRTCITFRRMQEDGAVQGGRFDQEELNGIRHVATLRAVREGEDDLLLVVTADNQLRICRVDRQQPLVWRCAHEGPWPIGDKSRPVPLSALDALKVDDGWVVLGGFGFEGSSCLSIVKIDADGAFRLVHDLTSDSRGLITALHLARTPSTGGFRLLVGGSRDSHAELCELDETLRPRSTLFRRDVDRRVLAVRFNEHDDPETVTLGDRSGFVWCINLTMPPSGLDALKRLAWINRLQGSVATIKSVQVDGYWGFLVSSDTGRVALIDVEGRRLWKHRFPAPIVGIATAQVAHGQLAVVALRSGSVHVYRYISDRERRDSLTESLRLLDQEAIGRWLRDRETPPHRADLEVVWAIGRLRLELASPVEILRSLRHRTARAQFVRYLTEHAETLRDAQRDAAVAAMTYRDLALLQSYVGAGDHVWDTAIDKRLGVAAEDLQKGDNSAGARAHAQVLRLQRLGGNHPTPSIVMQRRPPDEDLREPWVRVQLAQLLGVSVSRAKPRDFPVEIIRLLADLPPTMVEACATAFGQVFSHGSLFAALARIVEGLYGTDLHREDAECVVKGLAPHRHHPVADLLGTIVSLIMLSDATEESWPRQRKEALHCIRHLGQWFTRKVSLPSALRLLQTQLIAGIPSELSVPPDSRPLTERVKWAKRLVGLLPSSAPRPNELLQECPPTWQPLIDTIVAKTRSVVRSLVELEQQYCERCVRPTVKLDEIRSHDRYDASVVLTIAGEGKALLRDVRVTIDVTGESGLLRAEHARLKQTLEYATFPADTQHVTLRGATRPAQRQLHVRMTLESDDAGVLHEETWQLGIDAGLTSLLSYRRHLPKAFAARCRRWFSGTGLLVVVLDEDLGPGAFVDVAMEKHAAASVNLDEQFRDVGRGRTYGSLNPQDVVTYLRRELPRSSEGDSRSLLVAFPTTSFIDGLSDDEALGGVLRALHAAWGHAPRREKVVMFVSSRHAVRIRAEAPDIRIESGHRLVETDEIAEGLRWIVSAAGASEKQAADTLETVGGDLRFLTEWMNRVAGASRLEREALNQALTDLMSSSETTQRLCDDLRGLDPASLLAVMAGSVCDTRLQLSAVTPGVYAAESVFSHPTKGAPKLVQPEGRRVTTETLQDIKADSSPSRPQSLWVQGVGQLSSIRCVRGSRAAELAGRLGVQYTTISRDFGMRTREVFRTGEPYRGLLLRFYQEAARASASSATGLDDRVFRRIRGDANSLAELFTIAQLGILPDEMLQDLSPMSKKADRQLLRRLGQLWQGLVQDHRPILARTLGKPKLAPLTDLARPPDFGALSGMEGVEFFVSDGASGDEYVCWLQPSVSMSDLRTALASANRPPVEPDEKEQQPRDSRNIRLLAVGPGARDLPIDTERVIAVISEPHVRRAASAGQLSAHIQQDIRAQWRHSVVSPYHTTGALPPDSPLFFGRDEELQSICSGFKERSVLIVGSRRIGKTSLLNRLHAQADKDPSLVAIYLDIAELKYGSDVLAKLHVWVGTHGAQVPGDTGGAGDLLDHVVQHVKSLGKTPLFLLNEIDKLLDWDTAFVSRLRSLHETGIARFVLVGYASALQELNNPNSPLFNFTEGIKAGERAITLRELDEVAATRLIELLETRVGLTWASEAEKREGFRLLLVHSYRIPWFLQSLCHGVCERLDQDRVSRIGIGHINAVIATEASTLWSALERVDYGRLLQRDASSRSAKEGGAAAAVSRSDELLGAAIPMVITAVARRLYFESKPGAVRPIDDLRLQQRSPLESALSFTVGEAREIVTETLGELLLPHEKSKIEPWLSHMPLADIFRALTLTLILEPHPVAAERFGFLLHLYPRELHQHYPQDVRLDTIFTNRAREFWARFEQQPRY